MSKELEPYIGIYTIFALIVIPRIICFILYKCAEKIKSAKLRILVVIITLTFFLTLALLPLAMMIYYNC